MIKVWLVCLLLFFSLAEFYEWGQTVTLPLPVYGLAGLLLALLSNPNRWRHLLSARFAQPIQPPQSSPATPVESPHQQVGSFNSMAQLPLE